MQTITKAKFIELYESNRLAQIIVLADMIIARKIPEQEAVKVDL